MNIRLILLIALVGVFSACDDNSASSLNFVNNDDTNDQDDDTSETVYKYICFRITCNNPPRGVMLEVDLFDADSPNSRKEGGGTNGDGYYYSGRKYDISKSYRIQMREWPTSTCFHCRDVSYNTNPYFWFDEYTTDVITLLHLGNQCGDWETSDCCW